MSQTAITVEELAALIEETGHHHHQAYIDSDGADPEWPLWYAGYLQAKLWDRGGSLPTRSLLVHLLLGAETAYAEAGLSDPWPPFYAKVILDHLQQR